MFKYLLCAARRVASASCDTDMWVGGGGW